MPTKADYVRRAPAIDKTHTCHADGCERRVNPAIFMCRPHWSTLPEAIRQRIWRHFRPGQEADKQPSANYLAAARDAIAHVRAEEDRRFGADARRDLQRLDLF